MSTPIVTSEALEGIIREFQKDGMTLPDDYIFSMNQNSFDQLTKNIENHPMMFMGVQIKIFNVIAENQVYLGADPFWN